MSAQELLLRLLRVPGCAIDSDTLSELLMSLAAPLILRHPTMLDQDVVACATGLRALPVTGILGIAAVMLPKLESMCPCNSVTYAGN